MTYTLQNLINSIAGVLKSQYLNYPVYFNPNQQGTSFPCFFIFTMPSTTEAEPNGYYMRDIGIDIVFVQQRNIVNGYIEILEIQDFLDANLETFEYTDGSDTAEINTFERQASMEDDEMHYKFHIKERVCLNTNDVPINEMEGLDASVKR